LPHNEKRKEKNNTALSDKKRYKKVPSIYIDFRVRTPERRTRASAEEETEKHRINSKEMRKKTA
jgi:hypothetical protein